MRNYREMEKVLAEISATNVEILRRWAKEMSRKNPARRKGGKKG